MGVKFCVSVISVILIFAEVVSAAKYECVDHECVRGKEEKEPGGKYDYEDCIIPCINYRLSTVDYRQERQERLRILKIANRFLH